MVRIGIDTGGTFSDFVALDLDTRRLSIAKVPSTPAAPELAIDAGLDSLQLDGGADSVVIGTTVATNALIERRGPTVGFIANEGFTDVPFIGRLDKERLYDLHWVKPRPLVRRRHCFGAGGRINHRGEVLRPFDSAALAQLREQLSTFAEELASNDIGHDEVVLAVCLLFSYLRPEHERAVAAVIRDVMPGVAISLSHEVSPLWREYERASTTIADAFVKPIVDGYVDAVSSVLRNRLGVDRWQMLASNGGYLRASDVRGRPVQLVLSGLAGGVVGAHHYATAAECDGFFSLDMGGTSCDIGLVLDGAVQHAAEFKLAFGIPITLPCVDVRTIGAGGGSVAWLDSGEMLHVGPRSAGAVPGPVAYGAGGDEATVTDANVVLGRLHPEHLLGGAMPIDASLAEHALRRLGEPLGLDPHLAALAVVRTADENMANAIRLIAVDRGIDPREQALIAFGGAGPLHARSVAQRLEMTRIIVPPHPGLCAAVGAMIAQARVDRVRTCYARSDSAEVHVIAELERELREDVLAELRRTVDSAQPILERVAAMRYEGQNYELEVELADGELDRAAWDELLLRFGATHERQYGFSLPGEPIELINLRVTALHPEAHPAPSPPTGDGRPRERRRVWLTPDGQIECEVFDRSNLPAGHTLLGPAVIEEVDSTTVLFAGDRLVVHDSGSLVIEIGGPA